MRNVKEGEKEKKKKEAKRTQSKLQLNNLKKIKTKEIKLKIKKKERYFWLRWVLETESFGLCRRRLRSRVGRRRNIGSDPATFEHEDDIGHGGSVNRVRSRAK